MCDQSMKAIHKDAPANHFENKEKRSMKECVKIINATKMLPDEKLKKLIYLQRGILDLQLLRTL